VDHSDAIYVIYDIRAIDFAVVKIYVQHQLCRSNSITGEEEKYRQRRRIISPNVAMSLPITAETYHRVPNRRMSLLFRQVRDVIILLLITGDNKINEELCSWERFWQFFCHCNECF
jgi:hypothetical protein